MDADSLSLVDTHSKVFIERMEQRWMPNGGASSTEKADESVTINLVNDSIIKKVKRE